MLDILTPEGAPSFIIYRVSLIRESVMRVIYFCGRVPWLYQYWPGGFMLFVVLCPGTPEGSTGSGSGFKASQKTGQRLKVSSGSDESYFNYNGLSLRWIRVKKTNKPKKNHFFRLFCKTQSAISN